LDYSKIEAGKLKVTPANHAIKTILAGIDSMMRPLAVKKNINFEVICGETLPAIIQTDHDRLHQCLINLVSNAIKFTSAGHVHLNVSLEHKDAKPFIRFDVEDTGIGILPDMQEHIFEPFAQVEKGSTRKYGGTGLGLPITSQLAHLLGGELTVSNCRRKGSTFSLLIPAGVDVTSLPTLQKEKIITTKENTNMYSGSVLIAEDDKSCQVLTTKLLERLGLDITTADDGNEALEKSENQSFDLIFMDVRMPNLNGLEATKILRKNKKKIPIIALTAHAMEGDRKLCIKAGCDEYLSKPIDHNKLTKILDRHLPAKKPT
ncbi:MAG: response regulator, partial [Planctomycetes bacterium]|nr:response regulator [Planctomycetota bacterium]